MSGFEFDSQKVMMTTDVVIKEASFPRQEPHCCSLRVMRKSVLIRAAQAPLFSTLI